MDQFRTASGQTGKDAYVFEAAQIANAQRDLDSRFARLIKIMETESPDDAAGFSIDDGAQSASNLRDQLLNP